MDGWVDGWVGVKAVLRIAYSNQKCLWRRVWGGGLCMAYSVYLSVIVTKIVNRRRLSTHKKLVWRSKGINTLNKHKLQIL
jgi:hypothetical protein